MKRPLIILLFTAIALAFGACNKHSWDEEIDGRIPTKKLFEGHDAHGQGGDHDEAGGTHPEKKSEAPPEKKEEAPSH